MTIAGSLRSGSNTFWSPKAKAVRTAPVALRWRQRSMESGRPVRRGASFSRICSVPSGAERRTCRRPYSSTVSTSFSFGALFFLVLFQLVVVMEELGVLGETRLVLYPVAQVVCSTTIAVRGACAFTICPLRVALGHPPKVQLRGVVGCPLLGGRRDVFGRRTDHAQFQRRSR